MPNFDLPDSYRADLANDATAATGVEDLELVVMDPSAGSLYEDTLRQAFYFLRRHDDGRYSSRTKMRVLNAAEAAEAARIGGVFPAVSLPAVALYRVPFTFDEATEVKRGGVVAVAVVWPDENGRTVLAVHQEKRRLGLGTFMLRVLRYPLCVEPVTSWVNIENIHAQQFMLANGMLPSQLNRSGGIQYQVGAQGPDEDGAEDYIDPLRNAVPRRRRDRPEPDINVLREELSEATRYVAFEDLIVPEEDEPSYQACDDPDCGAEQCVRAREREASWG